MSVEQLLFLLVLIAFPLLERLIRAMRARTGGSPAKRGPDVARGTVSRPRPALSVPEAGGTASQGRRTELPLPGSPLPPAPPQDIRHATPEQLRLSEREPPARRQRKHGPTASLRPGPSERPIRPDMSRRRVIASEDLRRAIVLTAILGPCRAVQPKNASQLG